MKLKLPHWSVNPRRKMDSAFSSGPSYTSHNFSKLMHEIGNFGHAAQFLFLKNTVYRKKLLYSPSCIISLKPKSQKIFSYLQIQQVHPPQWLGFCPKMSPSLAVSVSPLSSSEAASSTAHPSFWTVPTGPQLLQNNPIKQWRTSVGLFLSFSQGLLLSPILRMLPLILQVHNIKGRIHRWGYGLETGPGFSMIEAMQLTCNTKQMLISL